MLFGITVIDFAIINMAPGNPVDLMLDPNLPQEMLEARKELLGLNDPIWLQYWKWLLTLMQGHLGYSFSSFAPVTQLIAERLWPTVLLTAASMALGLAIAIPVGVASAVRQNSRFDYIVTGLSFVGTSIPQFFFGLALIYIFAVHLSWLPSGGMMTLGGDGGFWDRIRHMILPVFVLGVLIAGKKVRYVRAGMLEVLKQDYLRTAHAKGLHPFVVVNKHALRNTLLPIITVVGAEVPQLLGGSILIEQVFQWPGLGQLTIQSILSRDYPTLMGLNLVAALFVLLVNLITDVLYKAADPRINPNE
ncbi:MAG: oligopeptide transporter permease AppB [Paenibacillus sp.]|nr:oligopeptide transporter permease AppB [Paenibacillus sp.]